MTEMIDGHQVRDPHSLRVETEDQLRQAAGEPGPPTTSAP